MSLIFKSETLPIRGEKRNADVNILQYERFFFIYLSL